PHFVRTARSRIDNPATGVNGLFIDTVKRYLLLVPTNKDLNNDPAEPDNNAIGVDHYKCYRVKVTAGTPKFQPVTVPLTDQFIGNTPKSLVLRKMRHLCAPVSKNGEVVKNANIHLACFLTKLATGQPKHVRRLGVHTHSQFGTFLLGTIKERELCIPSTKTLTPGAD